MQKIDSALSNRLAKMSFICSLMVVALHGYCGPAWVHRLTDFLFVAVPLFFCISGYLFAGRMDEEWWYPRQILKKLRTLVFPYVLWNVIRWLFVMATGGTDLARMNQKGIDLHHWWLILGVNPFAMPLSVFWFVGCLIVIVFISPVFMVLRRRRIGVILLFALYLFGLLVAIRFDLDDADIGWQLYCWIRAGLFFGLGVYLRFHPIFKTIGRMSAVGCLVIGFLGVFGGLIAWLTMPFAMIGIWSLIGVRAWPRWLLGASFPIYCLHIFAGTLLGGFFKYINLDQGLAVFWLLKVSLMAVFSILGTLLMKRIFPCFSKFAFGGR